MLENGRQPPSGWMSATYVCCSNRMWLHIRKQPSSTWFLICICAITSLHLSHMAREQSTIIQKWILCLFVCLFVCFIFSFAKSIWHGIRMYALINQVWIMDTPTIWTLNSLPTPHTIMTIGMPWKTNLSNKQLQFTIVISSIKYWVGMQKSWKVQSEDFIPV